MEQHSSTPTDPRALRSRQALRDALLKLLETHPLDDITIRDIVTEAGVGYTTFFRHHPTKEALLDDVAAEQIVSLVNLSLQVMDAHDLHAGSVALFTYVKAHRPLWLTLLTGGAAGTIRDEFLRRAREIAGSHEPSDNWLPMELGTNLAVSGTLELLTWWLRQSDPPPIERIAEIHDRLVIAPIIAVTGFVRR